MSDRLHIHVEFDTRLAPDVAAGSLVDFSERRLEIWPNLSPARYAVHEVGPGWAIVTEGTDEFGVWAKERYDWAADHVSIKAIESNFCLPGDGTDIVISTGPSGGSSVVVDWEREPISPEWVPIFEMMERDGERLLRDGLRGVWERLADET